MGQAARVIDRDRESWLRVLDGGNDASARAAGDRALAVLLVEDDADDAFLVRNRLRKANPHAVVEIVSTYDAGLRAVRSGRFDAALVDQRLGASTGLSLIERARSAGVTIPLILLTGQTGTDIEIDAIRRGASDYIDKNEMTPRLLDRTIRYSLQRSAAAAELAALQRRYEAAVAGSHDGIWDWNLRTDGLYLSERFKGMLGLDDSSMPSTRAAWMARIHADDRRDVNAAMLDHVAGRTPTLCVEYRMQHCDGEYRWVFLRGLVQNDPDGRPERLAGSQSDITDRKIAEEETRHRALHDSMTGLANRSLLMDRLAHSLQRVEREAEYGFSVLYLDLDGFKAINDGRGHAAGDMVLMEVAARLKNSIRAVDCAARIGGGRVRRPPRSVHTGRPTRTRSPGSSKRASPLRLSSRAGWCAVGVSVGFRVVTDSYAMPSTLIGDADRAMYQAKLGRRRGDALRVVPAPRDRPQLLEADLRRALNRGELKAHYQAIVSSPSRQVVGYEALARWTDVERGVVSPRRFHPGRSTQ